MLARLSLARIAEMFLWHFAIVHLFYIRPFLFLAWGSRIGALDRAVEEMIEQLLNGMKRLTVRILVHYKSFLKL